MNKDSFTVALWSLHIWKNSFTSVKWTNLIFITELPSWSWKKSVIYICNHISNENIFFYWCEGHIDHSQLSLSSSCFSFVTMSLFNTIPAFPYLLLVGFFFFLFLLFWLKACTTFFLNYVSLSCDCYFWQFNSLWTGKLWNDCPLSFGINQLPGFKLIWQKL